MLVSWLHRDRNSGNATQFYVCKSVKISKGKLNGKKNRMEWN